MVWSAYLLVSFIWTGMVAKCVVSACDPHMFDSGIDGCLSDFNKSMETSGYQHSCPWPTEKRNYNRLKICIDEWASMSRCKGHGSLKDTAFLKIHKLYFRKCGQVQDPPLITLIMLIAPVIVVTLLLPIVCTYLATWSTDTDKS